MRHQKSKSNTLVKNVSYILEEYGEHIKNDRQLVLLYWQQINGVEMDKQSISTTSFLNKATSESDIINTRILLDAIKESD